MVLTVDKGLGMEVMQNRTTQTRTLPYLQTPVTIGAPPWTPLPHLKTNLPTYSEISNKQDDSVTQPTGKCTSAVLQSLMASLIYTTLAPLDPLCPV